MNKDLTYYLSNYLHKYLPLELNVSANTIRSYEKTFSSLIDYLVNEKKWLLKDITFSNITRDIILEFLNYLEIEKKNTIRTRNQRLAAIKSFYQYTLIDNVDSLYNIKQILCIKMKKYVKPEQDYLTVEEMKMLFDSIDTNTKIGKRNLVLLTVLYDTAGRAEEITKLKVKDIRHYDGQILLDGKGKKKRLVPVMSETMTLLCDYLEQNGIKEGYIFHKNSDKRNSFVADVIKSCTKKLNITKE